MNGITEVLAALTERFSSVWCTDENLISTFLRLAKSLIDYDGNIVRVTVRKFSLSNLTKRSLCF